MGKVSFSVKHAKKTPKDKWVKEQEHLNENREEPIDLGAEWEKLQKVETKAPDAEESKVAKTKK